jgi:hypothetical protein
MSRRRLLTLATSAIVFFAAIAQAAGPALNSPQTAGGIAQIESGCDAAAIAINPVFETPTAFIARNRAGSDDPREPTCDHLVNDCLAAAEFEFSNSYSGCIAILYGSYPTPDLAAYDDCIEDALLNHDTAQQHCFPCGN